MRLYTGLRPRTVGWARPASQATTRLFCVGLLQRGRPDRHLYSTLQGFFLGSNKVMQVALGRSVSDEIQPGLHKVSKFLCGNTGLFLTNMPKEEVESLFNKYEDYDFARTGSTATEKVELPEGPLEQFTHEMEPFLRKQGMPVRLNKGVVELVSDFVVCEEGKPLSPESARILRLLGIKMATFKLHLICRWSAEDFELYREGLDESDVESA
ncbi:Ribosome assembly factor mrt4 [Citrus sinensis]|uniref:Ribosome assembly factor mrt4 n=1 Tax=Citrus sinensis TaxID=2711 RepID=A0ACB8KBZ2_CITSI|nr:Ribosome assembly factor mrt4 [Citrus sinensis]